MNCPHFMFRGSHMICPHFQFSNSHVTHIPLLLRRESRDPPHSWFGHSHMTRPQFRFGWFHVNYPRGASDLPHHKRAPSKPMQVIPFRVIKPQANMVPTGIQDSTVRATSGTADSREPPHFRFDQSHMNRPSIPGRWIHMTRTNPGSAGIM